MAHLYDGDPDGRQAAGHIEPTRFRPRYRALSDAEKAQHDAIKVKADELAELFEAIPPSRYSSLAMTELEASVMWAIKGLTS